MRANDAAALAFWQPLLRPVDRALSILPPVRGKVYRAPRAARVRWPILISPVCGGGGDEGPQHAVLMIKWYMVLHKEVLPSGSR